MALTGRAVALSLLGLIVAVFRPGTWSVLGWILVVLALLAADTLLAPAPRRLHLHRGPNTQIRLGEQTNTTVFVSNSTKRRLRGVLRDGWQPSAGAISDRHTLSVPAGERIKVTTRLQPTRRGDRHAAAVTIRAIGPLGLAARQASIEVPGSVRVLPTFASRRHLPSRLATLRQIDGRSAVRTRGQGTEFDSLRDYVDGDDVRSLDWRASARRQSLVVRTWQPERDRRVVIVLDSSRTSAGRIDDVPRLDSAMDAALLLTALASRAGDRVEFLAGDRGVRARVSGERDRSALLHSVVTAMAPLEPALVEANWAALAGAVNASSKRRALVVLLTALEPAALEEGLLPVLPALVAHHRVVVASVADPTMLARHQRSAATGTADEAAYDDIAAERARLLQLRTTSAIESLGATVLNAAPDDLPLALVDHYLLLKRQGLL